MDTVAKQRLHKAQLVNQTRPMRHNYATAGFVLF